MEKAAYCIECGAITTRPLYGEYPELGEFLCSENCKKLYEARDDTEEHARRYKEANGL